MVNRLFNRASACFAAALVLVLPFVVKAANPVAVWDGASADYNFSELTRNGYTLGQIGGDFANTVAADGSYLQIAPNNTDAAITLKKSDSSNMGASTVIIKVEDIPADGGANRAMLSFLKLGSFNNNEYTAEFPFIGVAEERNRTRTSSFIWNNEIWNDSRNVRTDNAFSTGSHTVALAYSYAAGAAFYVDGVQRGASADLRSSGYNPLGVAIGGVADTRTSNKFYSMTGMKVTAVAFFDSKISDSDVANYVFPSDEGSVWTATVSSDTAWADIVWNKTWESDMSGATVQLTIESGATVTAPASLTVGNLSVSGAGTLTFAAGENTLSGTASIGTKVTLANGVTLKTSGVVGLSSNANDFSGGSLLDVVSGSTSLNAKECGLSGDITVEAGATLVNLRTSDALNYDANPVTTIKVYGTLDFGTTRWSTRGVARNCYYFYDGAVVKGAGQSNYGALDFIENSTGGAINLEGSVTLSAAIRVRGGANVALVNANAATLALSSTINGDGTFSKAGAGTLTFSGVPTLSTLTVSEGTLAFTTSSDVRMTTKYTAKPDSANMAYTQQSNWKGTVLADWAGAHGTQFDINAYGNANSVVEVTKLEGGYVSAANAHVTVVPTVKVSGFMKLSNGYSGKVTTLTKLTGGGVFSNATYSVDITTLDNFTGTLVPLIDSQYVGMKIGTINLSSAPAAGDKIVSLGEGANIGEIGNTKVAVSGVVDDSVNLEVKSDGIYVAHGNVTITVPVVEHTTVTVTAGDSVVEPTSPGANTYEVEYGSEVVVTYAVDADAYEIENGTIEFTATESTEVTAPTVTPFVAWIYDGNDALLEKFKTQSSAVTSFSGGNGEKARFAEALDATSHNRLIVDSVYDETTITYTRLPTVAVIVSESGAWTNRYASIATAVSAAAAGSTITLVDNVTLDETVSVASDKSITLDLGGKTITGPANGYALSNAGAVTIIGEGGVTGAGGIVTNMASAVTVISNGTYSATGDLFAKDPGSSLTVSGGTFNKTFDETYLDEGMELHGNNGGYDVREAKGWVYEAAGYKEYTGTWSGDIEYDTATGKARIENGNTYTAETASDGRMVTLDMTFGFDAINVEDDEIADAKAAVRLGAGANAGEFVFQLYTSDGDGSKWVDVTASGVTATTNVEFNFVFVLDMTNKTYTVKVDNATLTDGSSARFAFGGASATTEVRSVQFTGAGLFTSLIGSYEELTGFAEGQTFNNGAVTLTGLEADWLNGQNNFAGLSDMLNSLTQKALDTAYLLNLDITSGAYTGTNEFAVTGIAFDKDTDQNDTVVVTVTLTRHGAIQQNAKDAPIIGELKLKGGVSLPTSTFTTLECKDVTNEDFGNGESSVWTFQKGDAPAKFYQAVIE